VRLASGDVIVTKANISIFQCQVTSDVRIAPDSFLDVIFSLY